MLEHPGHGSRMTANENSVPGPQGASQGSNGESGRVSRLLEELEGVTRFIAAMRDAGLPLEDLAHWEAWLSQSPLGMTNGPKWKKLQVAKRIVEQHAEIAAKAPEGALFTASFCVGILRFRVHGDFGQLDPSKLTEVADILLGYYVSGRRDGTMGPWRILYELNKLAGEPEPLGSFKNAKALRDAAQDSKRPSRRKRSKKFVATKRARSRTNKARSVGL